MTVPIQIPAISPALSPSFDLPASGTEVAVAFAVDDEEDVPVDVTRDTEDDDVDVDAVAVGSCTSKPQVVFCGRSSGITLKWSLLAPKPATSPGRRLNQQSSDEKSKRMSSEEFKGLASCFWTGTNRQQG